MNFFKDGNREGIELGFQMEERYSRCEQMREVNRLRRRVDKDVETYER